MNRLLRMLLKIRKKPKGIFSPIMHHLNTSYKLSLLSLHFYDPLGRWHEKQLWVLPIGTCQAGKSALKMPKRVHVH